MEAPAIEKTQTQNPIFTGSNIANNTTRTTSTTNATNTPSPAPAPLSESATGVSSFRPSSAAASTAGVHSLRSIDTTASATAAAATIATTAAGTSAVATNIRPTSVLTGVTSGRHTSVLKEAITVVKNNNCSYFLFLLWFLCLHWIDMGSDIYLCYYFQAKDHHSYFYISLIFILISSLLALFWNLQLYDRDYYKSFLGVILGPVSRNVYLIIYPTKHDATHRRSQWRNSDSEDVQEVRNFYYLFAALLEDWPQAIINISFLATHSRFSVFAYIQIGSSIIMGCIKFYYGCSNLLSDNDDELLL
jgi:hypothetical protein